MAKTSTNHKRNKKNIESLYELAQIQYVQGNFIGAIENYKQIIIKNPEDWLANKKIGECLLELKIYDLAVSFLEEAVNLNPEYILAYKIIGELYSNKLNDSEKAFFYFKKYIEKEQNDAGVYNLIGLLYKNNEKNVNLNKQIKYYKKAIEISPGFTGALRNLAIVYMEREETHKLAIECFEKIITINPIQDDFFAYSILKIKQGDFKTGWKYYESRFAKFFEPSWYPKLEIPRWDGQEILDSTLLIHYEQGFGDSLCFLRFLPEVIPKTKKTIVLVQDSLVDLFKLNVKNVEFFGESTPLKTLDFDYHIPMMSLPFVLKTEINNIPLSEGYIKADEDKILKFKKEFFDNDCIKIGISWNGTKHGNTTRNIPLEKLDPLAELKNVKLYSFQKGFGEEQLEKLPNNIEIIDLGKTFNDFSDTAAAASNLDLFITTDNGVFNLVAAMGGKTILLLSNPSEWRWFYDEVDKTRWYKSVRIFKKKTHNETWESIIKKVIKYLKSAYKL